MSELSALQLLIIALCFIWGGFVRSGLGFGGAALTLPILLLVHDDPLLFLPLIAVHLMIFSAMIPWQSFRAAQQQQPDIRFQDLVDWSYLKHSLSIITIPKLFGVLGLLTLPTELVSLVIFVIVLAYAISYMLNKPFRSHSPWAERLFLVIGGYVSGTSLMGAPLLVAVYSNHVSRDKLRNTLFVLWFILVLFKMAWFVIMDVDMQWIHHLWLLPCVYLGHLAGLRFHARLQQTEPVVFYRVLGTALLVISLIGIVRTFL